MKIFADVADLKQLEQLAKDRSIDGFTTNPSLMLKAGVRDYKAFVHWVLERVGGRPVSFEVVADDFDGMDRQARVIARWGRDKDNVYVKIPITNTRGEYSAKLIHRLSSDGVKLNVTAVMTRYQAEFAARALDTDAHTPSIISIFAGRIADTGVDPVAIVQSSVFAAGLHTEVLWASTREVLNVVQARNIGCHIITMTPELIGKLGWIGTGLDEYSLETVRQFYSDARAGRYEIE